MEAMWRRDFIGERTVEIFQLQRVYVVDECLILDDQLRVIANASDEYTDDEINRAIAAIQRGEESRTLPHHGTPTIVAKRRAAHNYGHFLMEMLPMAIIASRLIASTEAVYLVHRVPPASQDVIFRSFRLMGVSLERLLVQGFGEPMFFEQLIIVRGLTEHGKYMSPLSVVAVDEMAKKVFDIATTMPGRRYDKVFVRRVPGWKRGRALLNEDEVATRLGARGYYVTEPGSLTLEQQIMTFRGARQVVGVCGAAMTNIAFCTRGASATLLFPAMFPDVFFWFIATHKGVAYSEIRGAQQTYDGPASWESGFTISEQDIRYLETL
jgi:capsular polysaccharide biosynthesis protein